MSPTFPHALQALAAAEPGRIALRNKHHGVWQEITRLAYWEQVQATGWALWQAGVRPGDCVSILSDNRPEWLYADLGTQLIGARAVGIYQTNPPEDVAYVLAHSRSKVLVAEDQEQLDKAVACRPDTPDVEGVVVVDFRGCRHVEDERVVRWEDFVVDAPTADWVAERLAALDADAPSMVVYTSGTTGPPKGALLTPRNALSAAEAMLPELGVTPDDQLLSYLPLCHVAEKIFTVFLPMTTGAVVHFGESIDTVQQDLREVSPTIFLGVPRIWEKVHAGVTLKLRDASWVKRTLAHHFLAFGQRVRAPGATPTAAQKVWLAIGDVLVYRALEERLGLRRCRLPISGAAPISPELIAWFHGLGVPVLEGYGMTECAGVSHVNRPGRAELGKVGPPIRCLEQKLADDGEILVRGAPVFAGYLHNPEATADTVDTEGWLHTGDLGVLDEHGALAITGRKKEILISAVSKKPSPEKIENALKTSPYIKEAVAVGDARKFVSALIQIDAEAVGDWATRRKIPYGAFADLAGQPEVRKLVEDEVRGANDSLARVEQVRAFRLLPRELHQDNGELTATQKVRRREVMRLWEPLVDQIYA